MSTRPGSGTPADQDDSTIGPDEWAGFEDSLDRVLSSFGRGDVLQLSAPPGADGRSSSCVVRWARIDHLRVTAVGPGEAEEVVASHPADEVTRVARDVVEVCRDEFCVPTPELLTVRARGGVAGRVGLLGLTDDDGVPSGIDPIDEPSPLDVAVPIEDPLELRRRIATVVEGVTGQAPEVDPDGDLVFPHAGGYVFVTLPEGAPSIRIWSIVVRPVGSRRMAALETAVRNRSDPWTSWVLEHDALLQRTTVDAWPYVPRHLYAALHHFLVALAATRDDLMLMLAEEPGSE